MASDSPMDDMAFDGLTLLEVIDAFEADGYTGQFIAREGSIVECAGCHARTPANEMVGDHRLVRLEGASDPDDMLAVAALRCPSCAMLGTLVLKFGPEASAIDADVLQCLDVPAGTNGT
ncbi:MAG: hypothetical protein WD598_15275 [Acidimicrobiia bacterium]